ncbi:hypothetical protein BO94DRAFT_505560 [Aspergillus sclerotioniger CBS 115572]|uniref:Acyltransferase 3 domain-containing protein n=1 Tax=Aspergillus sclerotioniger CBS 115572 TaxID=1450535 RepID=A0A317XDH0_9EURO|nr:hypothetical protein BO94DRAFT_505560 [Aspergillus sclerotioniger CBS 115572]PWY96375.1 hypothetical protein BO94DRAFT_505560 [Aspergillus sclerotioniger CBS 115572]
MRIDLRAPEDHIKFLDGLRGAGAVLVYWHHQQHWAHRPALAIYELAFGFHSRYHFITLPGVRILFNGGHYAAAVFFVISGYVLSTRPLDLITSQRQGALAAYLSGALFRRWTRLYLPLIATTFLYMTLWHVFGLQIRGAYPQDSWSQELRVWSREVKEFGFPFARLESPYLSYNSHLWSIPVEFKGSLVIYAVLLALSRSSRRARISCQLFLMLYFMYAVQDGWYLALFMSGMLLREIDVLENETHLYTIWNRPPTTAYILSAALCCSLYLGGVPHCPDMDCVQINPGWKLLSRLVPRVEVAYDPKWHFLLPAATLLIFSVRRVPRLRSIFEHRSFQWLGRISFGIYLIHGPVMFVFADTLYMIVGWRDRGPPLHPSLNGLANFFPLPSSGPLGLEIGFIVPQIILGCLTLGLAELVTRAVIRPSVEFASWLYLQTLATEKVE